MDPDADPGGCASGSATLLKDTVYTRNVEGIIKNDAAPEIIEIGCCQSWPWNAGLIQDQWYWKRVKCRSRTTYFQIPAFTHNFQHHIASIKCFSSFVVYFLSKLTCSHCLKQFFLLLFTFFICLNGRLFDIQSVLDWNKKMKMSGPVRCMVRGVDSVLYHNALILDWDAGRLNADAGGICLDAVAQMWVLSWWRSVRVDANLLETNCVLMGMVSADGQSRRTDTFEKLPKKSTLRLLPASPRVFYLEQEVAFAAQRLPAPLRGCGSAVPGPPVLQPGPGDAVPGQPVHLPGCGIAGSQLTPPRHRSGSGNHSACASLAYF